MPAPGASSSSRNHAVAVPWSALLSISLASLVLLGGCATSRSARDGPGTHPPPNLDRIADAEPSIEPIRSGGANKPYQALGRDYVPLTRDVPFSERGLASWYGRAFQGKRTSSGEPYDMYAMTAAHPTLPIPSYARIRNPANGREVVVRINDRGPFHPGRIVDLSYAAALRLDVARAVAPVELERLTFDDIRAGHWRTDGARRNTPPDVPTTAPLPTATAMATAAPAPAPPPPLLLPQPEFALRSETPMQAAATTTPDQPLPIVSSALVAATPAAPAPARGFWVQLGAFREAEGADSFGRRVAADVDWLGPFLATFSEASLYRVQAGPYASRDDAQAAAARIREALGLVPMVVERR